MEELIRSRIREALDVEPTPAGLRSRVISSVPMIDRAVRQPRRLSFPVAGQWAAGLVAVLLAIAIVAGFLYTRGALGLPIPVGPHPVPPPKL